MLFNTVLVASLAALASASAYAPYVQGAYNPNPAPIIPRQMDTGAGTTSSRPAMMTPGSGRQGGSGGGVVQITKTQTSPEQTANPSSGNSGSGGSGSQQGGSSAVTTGGVAPTAVPMVLLGAAGALALL